MLYRRVSEEDESEDGGEEDPNYSYELSRSMPLEPKYNKEDIEEDSYARRVNSHLSPAHGRESIVKKNSIFEARNRDAGRKFLFEKFKVISVVDTLSSGSNSKLGSKLRKASRAELMGKVSSDIEDIKVPESGNTNLSDVKNISLRRTSDLHITSSEPTDGLGLFIKYCQEYGILVRLIFENCCILWEIPATSS